MTVRHAADQSLAAAAATPVPRHFWYWRRSRR
jgi:hypothetical protein